MAFATPATDVAILIIGAVFTVVTFASFITVCDGDGKPDYKWLVTSAFCRLNVDYTL